MSLHRPQTLAVLTLLVLAAVALPIVAPVTAGPPPEAVCGLCTDDALDGGVEHSEVVVRVQDDGSADWTVRATLDERTAGELRDAPAERRDRVRGELTRRTVVDEVTALQTRIENRTLVATFTSADFAHRGVGGVLVADGLFPSHEAAGVTVHADRLAVHGPDGTSPTLVPDTATADGGAIVWTEQTGIGSETYLAFGADAGLVATGTSYLAVGMAVVERSLARALAIVALPTLLFVGVLVGLFRDGDRFGPDRADDGLATRIGLVVGAVAPVLLAAGVGLFLLGTSIEGWAVDLAIFVGLTLVSLVPQTLVAAGTAAAFSLWGDRISLDSYAWWVFPAASGCWLVIVGATGPNRLLGTWTTTVLLFLLLGAAHERSTLAAAPVAVVTLLTPTLAAFPFVSPSVAPSYTLLLWAVGTVVLGVALYALGRQESARTEVTESSDTEKPTAEAT
ncbi:hypothetical protein [Haloarchaeobius iranensis]|uniref:Uncharacterized protein n=1 Tax=Haloarchaeobius iranensis TaxID=996166 RepID=A0A1G9SYX6_9EURY|nr:hypothetical protein [Haloarchaeobius iranensis]SDM40653.1 hypothetical protein SAMN05192554_10242 [Haloarchaeobius iranensis]